MTASLPHPLRPPVVVGHRLGLVLGSGIAETTLTQAAPSSVDTPFGPARLFLSPEMVVAARHHATYDGPRPAHLLDHHRTVAALCAAGCDRVLAVASVGSLGWLPVGALVAPDDFYAPSVSPTFFADARGHVVPGFDEPWRRRVLEAWEEAASTQVHDGGVYAQTTGPRLETPAEVRALAAHADVVGMTVAAECILAREAGLAYAAVCSVDNLANGLAATTLTIDELRDGAARHGRRLADDLPAVVARLATAGPSSTPARPPATGSGDAPW